MWLFDNFVNKLEVLFRALHLRESYSVVKYNNFQLKREGDKITVYEQSPTNIVAYFIPEKSYIDHPKLYQLLTDMLPEFIDYFKNKKNLINEEIWNIVDDSTDTEIQ